MIWKPTSLKQALLAFGRSERGALAVWGAIILPVALGGAALAIDSTRLYNMDGDLQQAVDALAKAGAAELDGQSDSLTRADSAIRNLVDNDQKFGSTRGQVKIATNGIRFLSTLPASSATRPSTSMETTDPAEARYVEVTLETETVRTILPQDLIGTFVDVDMNATSIAVRSERVCGVAPIFVCNPYEGGATDIYTAMKNGELESRQIQFKRLSGNETSWGPGSFGWLDVPGYQGASDMREAVGIDIPDTCLSSADTVRLRTGNVNSMHHGFNVRFDMYDGSMSSKKTDPRYAPAENVVKGYSGSGCNMSTDTAALALPRDTCHEDGDCADGNGQFGDGQWDFIEYMRVNHDEMTPVKIDGTTYSINYAQGVMSPTTAPSRYAVYRWEIDTDCIPGPKTYGSNASTPEEGTPQCHTSGASSAGVDRRVFRAAVLNCQYIDANGGMVSGRDLPVETFVDVFMTEPMGSSSIPTLFGEIIGPSVQGIGRFTNERAETVR